MNQRDQILAALKTGATLTPMEALERFGCFRLGARIYELRRQGHPIVDVRADHKVPYSVYRMAVKP